MKKILLVDDQAHILRVIKLSLDRNGFEVDTALSGEIALQLMHEVDYDVVIAESELPTMSGKDLFESVARIFPHRLPLMLLVSDLQDQALVDWVNGCPYVEMAEKPISLRWLVARLSEFFGYYERKAANG